jgi:hypothetical protein
MGAFNNFINSLKATLPGLIPIGGTLVGTSEGTVTMIAQSIKGGFCVLDTLDTLVDIPYELLSIDMEVLVREYQPVSGSKHPRTRYTLIQMPPLNTKVGEVPGYLLNDYWVRVDEKNFQGDVESQYAPNFEGKRPLFLPTEISSAAYQAGYPNDATYTGGNPSDIIWADVYDPTKGHAWTRQRLVGTGSWGIPVSLNAAGDYEDNQYLDTIFLWIPKGNPVPDRPIQPTDYTVLPTGWQATPGADYATRILTEDLYRSTALRNPYGVLKSNWDVPLLVSDNPLLVRYGNTPGNTDFLNDTFWRGYYTPGLDTHQAIRTDSGSSDWTIIKIDQESGEFPDFVFKNFPIGVSIPDLQAAIPTVPYPVGGTFPNDCFDSAPAPEENKILFMSSSTKYPDGALKTPWSLWRRFDGLNFIQATLTIAPGDTFFFTRNSSGNLIYTFPSITLTAHIFNGNLEVTTGFNTVKWYRGATLIIFDSGTRKATNLGVQYNQYHEVSVDGKSLVINPEGFDITQEYKVGINHVTRPDTDYPANVLLKDATDDGNAFVADIDAGNGTTFKNGSGLYQFNALMFKGGLSDASGVVFKWTIRDAGGTVIGGGLRNSGGVSVGDQDYVATTVYVSGADIDQRATLELVATFGEIIRTDRITLTDVEDAQAVEVLYWGTGSTNPGNPTDFVDRTLTKAQVLALAIGYLEDGTGTWYMIQRINGVWGGEIQMRQEGSKGNTGIFFYIFKNVDFAGSGAPTAPSVPPTGSLVPAGWTQAPVPFVGSEDRQYTSTCFFTLRIDVPGVDHLVFTRDNYNPSGTYSLPYVSGVAAPPAAVPGVKGNNGWSPLYANVIRSSDGKVVQWLYDWFGGEGTKPVAQTTTSYVGSSGLGTIDNAQPITGPPGNDAVSRPQYYISFGSRMSLTNATIVTATNTETLIGAQSSSPRIIITNTFNASRAFVVKAEVKWRRTAAGSAKVSVYLRGGYVDLAALPSIGDYNFFTMFDHSQAYIDTGNQNDNEAITVQVSTVIIIEPGGSAIFLPTIKTIEGTVNRNAGFIEAWGL